MNLKRKSKDRLRYLDFARGVILLLMIFGHADMTFNQLHYSFEGLAGAYQPIEDLISFWMRAVTIFVAPAFFLISGMLIGLNYAQSSKVEHGACSTPRSLWQRGLFLLALELSVISLLWSSGSLLSGGSFTFIFQVIGAFGVAFLLTHYLRKFSAVMLTSVATTFLVFREFLPVVYTVETSTLFSTLMHIFLVPGRVGSNFFVEYPALSWLAIMLIGVAFGKWQHSRHERGSAFWGARQYFTAFAVCAGLFVFLRSLTSFGNFFVSEWNTVEAFILVSKYPPSVLFVIFGIAGAALTCSAGKILLRHRHIYRHLAFIELIGRRALPIYVLHLIFIRGIDALVPALAATNHGIFVTIVMTILTVIATLLLLPRIPRTKYI